MVQENAMHLFIANKAPVLGADTAILLIFVHFDWQVCIFLDHSLIMNVTEVISTTDSYQNIAYSFPSLFFLTGCKMTSQDLLANKSHMVYAGLTVTFLKELEKLCDLPAR